MIRVSSLKIYVPPKTDATPIVAFFASLLFAALAFHPGEVVPTVGSNKGGFVALHQGIAQQRAAMILSKGDNI